jgi:hypothetical protein
MLHPVDSECHWRLDWCRLLHWHRHDLNTGSGREELQTRGSRATASFGDHIFPLRPHHLCLVRPRSFPPCTQPLRSIRVPRKLRPPPSYFTAHLVALRESHGNVHPARRTLRLRPAPTVGRQVQRGRSAHRVQARPCRGRGRGLAPAHHDRRLVPDRGVRVCKEVPPSAGAATVERRFILRGIQFNTHLLTRRRAGYYGGCSWKIYRWMHGRYPVRLRCRRSHGHRQR